MLCQDRVLKENWTFRRGDLYIVDHKRGQRPRESTIEISVVLWPEEQTETTKWYMVAPITLDVTGKDADTDVIVRDRRDIGKPFAVTLVHAHMVADWQLLAYVGRLNDKVMAQIIMQMKTVLADYCDINGTKARNERCGEGA